MSHPKFDDSVVEGISQVLGDAYTSSQLYELQRVCSISHISQQSTKWRFLKENLSAKQSKDGCSNNLLNFIQTCLSPTRFVNRESDYHSILNQMNQYLSFSGLTIDQKGQLKPVEKAQTISEAKARASELHSDLFKRAVHPEVLRFCREELLVDNYFHAVFEASKSMSEKIRQKTGLTLDGAALVDEAFSFKGKVPYLASNSLTTESEQSEQSGFINLIKGVLGMFRNTHAHAPKVTWAIDKQDALDILSTISLIHRRLDSCIEARKMCGG